MTFECISRDWDRISKIRARPPVRNEQGYNCISLLLGLGEACEHQVVHQKPPLVRLVAPMGGLGFFTFYKRVSLKPPMRSASVPTAGTGQQDIGLDGPGQRFAGPIF